MPPDARFCHRCGKPQFAELITEPDPTPPPLEIPAAVEPQAVEIGFTNPLAVRIGLFLAILTFLLSVLLGPFIVIWMLVAGAIAVWLYAKRTGSPLTAGNGARLGWITGLFTFLISLVLVSITALALSDQAFVDAFLAQMRQRGAENTAQELVSALQSPDKIFLVVVQMFLYCGLLPVLGGLLGAKLFRGSSSRA